MRSCIALRLHVAHELFRVVRAAEHLPLAPIHAVDSLKTKVPPGGMTGSPLADAPLVDDVLAWSDEQPAVEGDATERLAERLARDRVPNTG